MKNILTTLSVVLFATTASARDNIQIAGSSTVLPYASIVAEAFGENFDFPTPVVESGGSSAGLKRFCEGVGYNTIDIANASRRIRDSELKACAENGVESVTEVRFGYDGIVFASDIKGNDFKFTPKDIYLALHKDSKAKLWSDVNPELPSQEILVFVPGTKHGTREVFEEKVLLEGCKEIKVVKTKEDKKACISIRTDNRSIDIDGDYTETLSRINANKHGIGVLGLSFYENNTDKLKVASINSIYPSIETISSGKYPVSRPLYFYIKDAHINVVPGLLEYAKFFVLDEIAGPDSPLAYYGLVPDPELHIIQNTLDNK